MRYIWAEKSWIDGRFEPELVFEIKEDTVTKVLKAEEFGGEPHQKVSILSAACADIQVNGAGDVMFNSSPSPHTIVHMIDTLSHLGTGWIMPTLITTSIQDMQRAAAAAKEAMSVPGFMGIHFEGPYINPKRKGTHALEFVRKEEPVFVDIVRDLRNFGVTVLVTLAPEMVSKKFIGQLVDLGAVVSAGHSDATYAQACAAIDAGVSCFTHLFNAMPPMLGRDPGLVAAALASNCWCGIIADGFHVSWEMIELAWRSRPEERRFVLVSDAMSTVGGAPQFELYGETIGLVNGRLVNAAGALAGAHVDMVTSMRNLFQNTAIPLDDIFKMAIDAPWACLARAAPPLGCGMPLQQVIALNEKLELIPVVEQTGRVQA